LSSKFQEERAVFFGRANQACAGIVKKNWNHHPPRWKKNTWERTHETYDARANKLNPGREKNQKGCGRDLSLAAVLLKMALKQKS